MTDGSVLEVFRNSGLMPHQSHFAAAFLKKGARPYHLLISRVGMGKMQMAGALCAYVLTNRLAKRILILTPAPLTEHYKSVLTDNLETVPIALVDMRTFRELQANVGVDESPWPESVVAILSLDTAKKEKIAASLSEVEWDLVLVDEAHLLTGKRGALVERLINTSAAHRVLFMTTLPREEIFSSIVPDIAKTEWRYLTDWEGKSLMPPEAQSHLVDYVRSEGEIDFIEELKALVGQLPDNITTRFLERILLRRAGSTMFAIEQSLIRLRNRLAHGFAEELPKDEWLATFEQDDTDAEVDKRDKSVWFTVSNALEKVEKLLQTLDRLDADRKLGALLQLLAELTKKRSGHLSRICIYSSFRDTVSYLSSSVVDAGFVAYQIVGAMAIGERERSLREVLEQGGILIATSVSLEGMDLTTVDSVIHYDLPGSEIEMEARRSRVDRIGRTRPYTAHIFRDSSEVLALETELLRLHFPNLVPSTE